MIKYRFFYSKTMNNKTIPSLLVATVMIAGIFAFMPVEQASAVHTTIQNTQFVLKAATDTATGAVEADPPTFTINTAGPTQFVAVYMDYSTDTATDEVNILTNTIDCDGLLNIEHVAVDPGTDDFTSELISVLESGTANTGASNPLHATDANDCVITLSNIAGTHAAADDITIVNVIAWTESQDALTVTAS